MVKGATLVGAGIVHPTRPTIKHLIGEQVKVVHVTEGHGEWEGKLQHKYLGGIEKAENFVYFVEGAPCSHCGKHCTAPDRKNKMHGCRAWRDTQVLNGTEKDTFKHSSQPELKFGAHTVYRIDGHLIVLG
jgi:hypothetical protein